MAGSPAWQVGAPMLLAVSNAVRHSGATQITVTLDVTDHVVVEVIDDGRGIDEHVARSGLRNLEDRARRRSGEADVQRLTGGGTRLRWSAPLH